MPPPPSAAPAHVLTAERRQKLEQELPEFEPRTQARGDGYVRDGRVVELRVKTDFVSAVVAGTTDYRVDWSFDGVTRDWSCRCSCPVGIYCKHAYAVARVVLDGAKVVGRAAEPASGSPVARALVDLRDGDREWQRMRGLQTLLNESRARDRHEARMAMKEPDPDLRCWLIAKSIDRQPDARLVPALVPFLDRPDLEARRIEGVRSRLASDLVRIATAKRTTPPRTFRAELALEREARGELRLTIRARVTSSRLRDAPRTSAQLEKLKLDLVSDPESVAPEEGMLLHWLVDHQVGGHDRSILQGDAALVPVLLQRFARSGLVRWAEDLDPDAAERARISPASIVRLDPSPGQIRPGCTTRNGQPWVHLEVAWADGRSLPYDDVVHVPGDDLRSARVPGVVLSGGSVTCLTAEPAEKLRARFQVAHGFGIDEADREETLTALSSAFPGVRAGVERHTRNVPCSAIVAVDLREDDWFQIRLFARAEGLTWRPGDDVGADEGVFELVPDGQWVRMRAEQPVEMTALDPEPTHADRSDDDSAEASARSREAESPADSWFDRPDPAAVEPLEAWLRGLDARPGTRPGPRGAQPEWEDRDVGWWMRATSKGMAALGAQWDDRPAGVEFFGNTRTQRLFGPTRRVVPKLKIHASGVDWFRMSADWYSEALTFDERDLALLRSSTTRFVKLSSGWVQRDAADQADAGSALLAELGLEAGAEEEKISLWQLAAVSKETLAELQAEGADPETVQAVRELQGRIETFHGIPEVEKPLALEADLRPYQQHGVNFLSYAADLGLGMILADDMGLGKTLQALAWLASNREREPVGGPSLVVCPTSVQSNWQREARRFLPTFDVVAMERGTRRHALWDDIEAHDLVITNYALLRRDIDRWKEIPLRAVIFDEAQNLKNPDASATRAARRLDARHRVALTGTPLENRTLDLWSILSVVSPGFLGSRRSFSEHFDHAELPPHRRALLSARLRPLLLRRLKREVAPDLPDRIEETRECELTPGQRKLYLAEVARSRALVEEIGASKDGLKKNRIEVLAALTRLRQICCHPALGGGEGAEALGSGKLDALFELVEPLVAEGHKVLVFSQFVGYLEIVAQELERRGIPQYLLTGATRDRAGLIDGFTNDPRAAVFLLSLKAGGAGLNLTSASYVVLLDPWWNPAAEAQAIDRSHRIGQDRTVIAYRLVARGTIEEKILELQEKKSALMRDVLGEEGQSGRLTREDLAFLLEPTDDA